MFDYQMGDELPVLDLGYVKLHDKMGSDETICKAARISYGRHEKVRAPEDDRKLIRHLVRHRHTSPLEMGELLFEIKMPIFVARQWVRHRTASLNEYSLRYSEAEDDMFVPGSADLARQSKSNKQGRGPVLDYEAHERHAIKSAIRHVHRQARGVYDELIQEYDLARELARGVLPLNQYTKIVWKIDLHNLMHFLKLRTDSHAQKEIVAYAETIEKLVALYYPVTYEAWRDYSKLAYTLSAAELGFVQSLIMIQTEALSGKLSPQKATEQRQRAEDHFASQTTERERKEFRETVLKFVRAGD